MPEIYRWAVVFIPFVGLAVMLGDMNGTVARMKIHQSGFTLIELMVTVAIAALLASLAVPSFQSMLAKNSVDSAADALASDMRFARSEAVKRTSSVTVCASSNGTSCTGADALWKSGWIVFVDINGDATVDAGEQIVRVQGVLPSIASIAASDGTSKSDFKFQPTGWAKAASQTFIVTPTGSNTAGLTRIICVSNQGRAGVRAREATSCS